MLNVHFSMYNAELARNPIWHHAIDASRVIDRANGPPCVGVVLLFLLVFSEVVGL